VGLARSPLLVRAGLKERITLELGVDIGHQIQI
jgi:hypothetical protein